MGTTRTFDVWTPAWKNVRNADGTYSTEHYYVRVLLELDVDEIARRVAENLVRSKSGKSQFIGGAVKARQLERRTEKVVPCAR